MTGTTSNSESGLMKNVYSLLAYFKALNKQRLYINVSVILICCLLTLSLNSCKTCKCPAYTYIDLKNDLKSTISKPEVNFCNYASAQMDSTTAP